MFENGQKLYIFNNTTNEVETWIYYTGYDGKHIISDTNDIVGEITEKTLKKFSTDYDECLNNKFRKVMEMKKQIVDKSNFLKKEIKTLTGIVEDTKKNIELHKENLLKLDIANKELSVEFKPFMEKYPELFI